jgi:5'-nucleotidase
VRVLLTNDDGIDAEGLQRLRRELLATPGVELEVVAPDASPASG